MTKITHSPRKEPLDTDPRLAAAAWARSKALLAVDFAAVSMAPSSGSGGDWVIRRERVGALAESIACSAMDSLRAGGMFPSAPCAEHVSSGPNSSKPYPWSPDSPIPPQGFLAVGGLAVRAWPARESIAYHDGDEVRPPLLASSAFCRHAIFLAATLVAGSRAEALIAKRIANRAIGNWILHSCAHPSERERHGEAIISAFERSELSLSSHLPVERSSRRRSL